MRETRLPACHCPYCETRLDAATNLAKVIMPKPGDISVCIQCAQILIFADDLTLRKPLPADKITITDEIKLYQQAVRMLDRRH
jgi:hypothetical protein